MTLIAVRASHDPTPQYTATESTNYFFDVKSSQLRGAMDRFAQFFQTPLFAESALERELQAVDSEHSNNKNEDTWRLYQVTFSWFTSVFDVYLAAGWWKF